MEVTKMKKTILSVLVIALLSVSFVSAFGFGKGMMDFEDDEEIQVFRESVENAVETNDFDFWKKLMESRLTQKNFETIVERHNEMKQMKGLRVELREAIEDGDDDRVEELKKQLSELMPGRPSEKPANGDGFFGRFRRF